MYCPNCGKDCGNSNFCSFCGASLHTNSSTQEALHAFSFSKQEYKLKGASGYIILLNDSLILRNNGDFFPKDIVIPYDQLTYIAYNRPKATLLSRGTIVFRWKSNNKPIPHGNARLWDKYSIQFGIYQDIVFYHVYRFLEALVASHAKVSMEIPQSSISDMTNLFQEYEMNKYFERFNPYRFKAINALRREKGTYPLLDLPLVEKYFDLRQGALYSNNPSQAAKDLERIITIAHLEKII